MSRTDRPADRPITLDPLRDARVDLATKGFPAVDPPITLGEVAEQGWSLEDLLPPVIVLREAALAHNIALMADYCATRGVENVRAAQPCWREPASSASPALRGQDRSNEKRPDPDPTLLTWCGRRA